MNRFFLLLLLLPFSLSAGAHKPKPDTLLMDISVSEYLQDTGTAQAGLQGSFITIYQYGISIGATDTSLDGRFSIALILQDTGDYVLVAYKPGYVPKRITISPCKNLSLATGKNFR